MSYAITRTALAAFAATLAMMGPAFAAPASGACSIMSKAEVKPFSTNRLFDQSPPEEMQEGPGSSCSYAGVYIQLDVIPFATIENMSRDQKQES